MSKKQKDLAHLLADKTGILKKDAEQYTDVIFESILEILEETDLQIIGFGAFNVVTRAEREGHNPSTGEKITIPEKEVVRFKLGKKLKDVRQG